MRKKLGALCCAAAMIAACKSNGVTDTVKSAGSSVGSAATSLVNVDLSNVLNDLALDLKIDKSNIPINAQIPISVAANVCGVSISLISIGGGSGSSKGCTATTASPELVQAVQQQLAANGNVGGGAQTNSSTAAPSTTSGTSQPASGTTTTEPQPTTQPQ